MVRYFLVKMHNTAGNSSIHALLRTVLEMASEFNGNSIYPVNGGVVLYLIPYFQYSSIQFISCCTITSKRTG